MNSLQFLRARVISLQFLLSWDIFWVKRTKNYSCNGEFFEIFIFILVIGVFLSGVLRVCCFDTNHLFSFGWFVDIFYPSSVYFLQFLPVWDFLGWKWTKIFLVMVNALKFWYLFKWFGLFYLEFCVGGFFWHNWPFFFCLIHWHFSPFKGQLLKIFTFLRFYFGENGQKITLVRVNPFIFLYFP